MEEMNLCRQADTVNELLARYGVKFGIYKNGTFREQLFPFDAIPRVIEAEEFEGLERGLKQRVMALNCFIRDIYGEKKIVRDKVVPEEFVYASSGYLAQCEGVLPPKGIYTHIAGIDLVQGKDGQWYILEDNLRVPSGASYPMIARELCRRSSPRTFQQHHIADNRNYAELLRKTMDHVNTGGHTVILTPGRYNAAYFEHSYLAEKTGAHLVTGSELLVENDHLYFIDYSGRKERVGAVYRRISDEYLDPMNFREDSVFGYRFSIWMILFNRQTAGRDRPRSFCPAGAECPRPCPRSWTRERASRRRRRRWRAVPRRCRRGPDRNCVRRTCRT